MLESRRPARPGFVGEEHAGICVHAARRCVGLDVSQEPAPHRIVKTVNHPVRHHEIPGALGRKLADVGHLERHARKLPIPKRRA
jgi:hypothetical protein